MPNTFGKTLFYCGIPVQSRLCGVSKKKTTKYKKLFARQISLDLILKFIMTDFQVSVTIENKPGISDPEGQTILNDLVLKGGDNPISRIKTAKMLKFTIKEKDKKSAQSKVREICDDLRIYNPMVSKITVDVDPI